MTRPGTSLHQDSRNRRNVWLFLFCLLFFLLAGGCANNQKAINRLETEERLQLLLLGPFEIEAGYGVLYRELRDE